MYSNFGAKEIPANAIHALGFECTPSWCQTNPDTGATICSRDCGGNAYSVQQGGDAYSVQQGAVINATQEQVNSYRSEWEEYDKKCRNMACPDIALPYNCPEGSTIRFTGAPPAGCCDHPAYTCEGIHPVCGGGTAVLFPFCNQQSDPSGNFFPQQIKDTFPEQYEDPNCMAYSEYTGECVQYKDAPIEMDQPISVLCSDGTYDVDNGFVPPCRGHGGEAEIMDEENTPSNDAVNVESEMFSDENPCAGVRCIALYKPCPEGYISGNKCCPNTGNCIPDPNYVGVAKPALPIGQTPSTELTTYQSNVIIDYPNSQFDQTTPIAIAMRDYSTQLDERIRSGAVSLTPPESQYTLLDTPSTTTTSTTETSTAEEPKEGGLGIIALGLIALELLAT
jgi:hypothetical protein